MRSVYYIDGERKEIQEKSFLNKKQLSIRTLENGIVLPPKKLDDVGRYAGGVCDSKGNFHAGLIKSKKLPGWFDVIDGYDIPEKINYIDESVIFGGVLISHFGHFLLECMSRLWFIINNKDKYNKIVFVCIHDKMDSWFYVWLELLGISEENVQIIREATQYRKIFIPDESIHSDSEYYHEYRQIYKLLKGKLGFSPIKRVYLSRRYVHTGISCINEEYFEDFFARKGFCVVHPELYSVKEQAEIVHGADEIICTVGSISHWALFLKENAHITILLRDKLLPSQLPINQKIVNEVSNVNCTWLDVSKNWLPNVPGHGACLLGETKSWCKYVEDMYGGKVTTESWKDYTLEYIVAWERLWISTGEWWQNWLYRHVNSYDFMERISDVWSNKKIDFLSRKEMIKKKQNECNGALESKKEALESNKYLEKIIERVLKRNLITYRVHLGDLGWGKDMYEGQTAGRFEHKYDIQAIVVNSEIALLYKVYFGNGVWSEEAGCGEVCGTTGQSKSIHGISICLDRDNHNYSNSLYDICYRVYNHDLGWSPWAKNGDMITNETEVLNAIEIKMMSGSKTTVIDANQM